mmetsp:Transcript_97551/g.260344  ORF Transcript_97551/g.260344 Transcript_97551/m.260344 type:complete len:225 (+) Transcript_97551:743-1417(+)
MGSRLGLSVVVMLEAVEFRDVGKAAEMLMNARCVVAHAAHNAVHVTSQAGAPVEVEAAWAGVVLQRSSAREIWRDQLETEQAKVWWHPEDTLAVTEHAGDALADLLESGYRVVHLVGELDRMSDFARLHQFVPGEGRDSMYHWQRDQIVGGAVACGSACWNDAAAHSDQPLALWSQLAAVGEALWRTPGPHQAGVSSPSALAAARLTRLADALERLGFILQLPL